jgi:hypothetical protein
MAAAAEDSRAATVETSAHTKRCKARSLAKSS